MNPLEIFIVIGGLVLFEVVSSIDNAIVNADVLETVSAKARRWFLLYGLFFAVFVVRGILPLLIVFLTNPSLGIAGSFFATFNSDPLVQHSIEASTPILLAGGGIYLIFLFLNWLFVEEKQYAFFFERFIHHKLTFWFYSLASLVLLAVIWLTIDKNPYIALGATIGSTAFFITNGVQKTAEEKEKQLTTTRLSDVTKILYLELIDTTFSIDGVLGAFAFTTSIPLILAGNGVGAIVVRSITIHHTKTVRKYRYLKNGAMYSIGVLGTIMILEAIGTHPAIWIPPLATVLVVSGFFWLSKKELDYEKAQGHLKG